MDRKEKVAENPKKGFAYALAGMVFVSTNFVTAKYALAGFNVETFSFLWTSAAAFYAFLIVVLTGHVREMRLSAKSLFRMALMGLTTAAAMLLGWAALSRLDPSFAAFLARFMPVMVILLGVLVLKERLHLVELLPIALMLVGGCVSVIGRWEIVGVGVVLMLLSNASGAGQRLIAKMESARVHPEVIVFYRVALGAVLLAAWVFGRGKADFNVAPGYWLAMLIGAFMGPCLSHVLTFRAYRYWTLSRCTMVLMAQPLIVLPMAWLFLGRFPSPRGLLGGLLILAGAFWMVWIHLSNARKRVVDE